MDEEIRGSFMLSPLEWVEITSPKDKIGSEYLRGLYEYWAGERPPDGAVRPRRT